MKRTEWLVLADEYQSRADAAYSHGDEIEAERLAKKADSCRYASQYGTEENEERKLCPYCHGQDLDLDGDSGGGCTHCINGYLP